MAACDSAGKMNATIQAEKINASIASGDPSLLPDSDEPIVNRTLSIIEAEKTANDQFLTAIYGSDTISYDPTRNSQLFSFKQLQGTYPLIKGNKGENLAVAVDINGQHNAAFGTNIIRGFYEDKYLNYEKPFKNLLAWLLKRDSNSLTQGATVKLAFMNDNTINRTTSWLSEYYPNWTISYCTENNELAACLDKADLVISASNSDINKDTAVAAIKGAQTNGAALLYVHAHGWGTTELATSIISQMNLLSRSKQGDYFSQDTASWNNYKKMLTTGWDLDNIYQLISAMKNNTFPFDLGNCDPKLELGCDETFNTDFKGVMKVLRSTVNDFDEKKLDIFSEESYEIEKLLILLADFYRQSIVYPMDVNTTPVIEFLQAYFSGHLVYNN